MGSANDNAGRIRKEAFIVGILKSLHKLNSWSGQVSTALLFCVCLMSTSARLYIRIHLQKQFSIDDGLLIVAVCCLTIALSMIYSLAIDAMYLEEALTTSLSGVQLPVDPLEVVNTFHKWATIILTLCWCAVAAVKFSFLFFFRRLIDRIPPLILYWWIVTFLNLAVFGYGIAVQYETCPYFSGLGIRKLNEDL